MVLRAGLSSPQRDCSPGTWIAISLPLNGCTPTGSAWLPFSSMVAVEWGCNFSCLKHRTPLLLPSAYFHGTVAERIRLTIYPYKIAVKPLQFKGFRVVWLDYDE